MPVFCWHALVPVSEAYRQIPDAVGSWLKACVIVQQPYIFMGKVILYSTVSAGSMPCYEFFRACTSWLPAVCAASESGDCLSNMQAHRRQCVFCSWSLAHVKKSAGLKVRS